MVQSIKLLGHYYEQGVQAVSLGYHSVPELLILLLTITKNPKFQESCSSKLKEIICYWLVLLSRPAHLCIFYLNIHIGLEHLFIFSLHGLTFSSSHQIRASEEKGGLKYNFTNISLKQSGDEKKEERKKFKKIPKT